MSELFEDPFIEAQSQGLVCILPEPNQLFLDIDDDTSGGWMQAMFGVLESNNIAYEIEKTTISKSGNKHVYVRFPKPPAPQPLDVGELKPDMDQVYIEFDDVGRVALQAALGSDRKRELLSMLRILLNLEARPPTTFFEKPEASGLISTVSSDDIPF